jgi:6-pyruvoyltetrahydropterin/6-carboxytetrahydropterin synthase
MMIKRKQLGKLQKFIQILNFKFKKMYTIRKEFHFSASHVLTGLAPEHPCSRLHGHNYIVVAEFESIKLNDVGFVIDYRDLEEIKKFIDDALDHKHLNDFFDFNPSAENMAKFLFKLFKKTYPQLSAIEVSETPKTNARYSPNFDV